jgi:hypothetical protein
MSINKDLFRAKALAFNNSIRAMGTSEKGSLPTATFGDDYNELRKNVLTDFPHLSRFMPPGVNTNSEFNHTDERYCEIDAFCEQIYQLLSVPEV